MLYIQRQFIFDYRLLTFCRSAPLSQFSELHKITHTSMISQSDSLHVNAMQKHFAHVVDNTYAIQSY